MEQSFHRFLLVSTPFSSGKVWKHIICPSQKHSCDQSQRPIDDLPNFTRQRRSWTFYFTHRQWQNAFKNDCQKVIADIAIVEHHWLLAQTIDKKGSTAALYLVLDNFRCISKTICFIFSLSEDVIFIGLFRNYRSCCDGGFRRGDGASLQIMYRGHLISSHHPLKASQAFLYLLHHY